MRPSNVKELFIYFIHEREKARYMKENGIVPHTADPILHTYRFCNINREHDAVTRWVAEFVRKLQISHDHMVLQLTVARVFNEPDVLRHVIPFGEIGRLVYKLNALKDKSKVCRIFRGAYMMPVHGTNGGGKSAITYWCENARALADTNELHHTGRLKDIANVIASVKGFGGFLANQVCADLRYTEFYPQTETEDWETFVIAGPGTTRGISRYLELKPYGPRPKTPVTQALVLKIRDEIFPLCSEEINEHFRDPNNLTNAFCEFDKFCRALEIPDGDTRHRIALRKYNK